VPAILYKAAGGIQPLGGFFFTVVFDFQVYQEQRAYQRKHIHIEYIIIRPGNAVEYQKNRLRGNEVQEGQRQVPRLLSGQAPVYLGDKADRSENTRDNAKESCPIHNFSLSWFPEPPEEYPEESELVKSCYR
jgi:hypothetical protein